MEASPQAVNLPPRGLSKREAAFLALFLLFATAAAGIFSYVHSHFLTAIHDEAGYLFLAKTFLKGRLTQPVHPEHLFFDQYHIINEGIYVSKYFPGTALALLPFVWAGIPHLGPVLFYGIHLLLLFLTGRILFGTKTAWLGMFLASFSPQIFLQSCFLLSHLPDAIFLLIFFLGFVQWRKSRFQSWIIVSGIGWILSFLTRPLTAVAFAAPIACLMIVDFIKSAKKRFRDFILWIAFFAIALILYGAYNHAVTGHWKKSPFDLYADIHAPYQRYGFYTWEKFQSQANGPRVDKRFNEFYHDHTPAIGLSFFGVRLAFFVEFLFGKLRLFNHDVSIGFFILALWFLRMRRWTENDYLIFSIWISLQLFYIPHWYPGILTFGSNYLYEVTGLVLFAAAASIVDLLASMPTARRKLFFLVPIVISCVAGSAFTLKEGGENIYQGRIVKTWFYKQFRNKKALVFIRYPSDYNLNLDLMDNVPDLDSNIVFARDRGSENVKLRPYFRGYTFYLWDYQSSKVVELPF